ncbi:hypothetical protein PNOK_0345400 [Pyrrhoderma noxium]|uniref:Uncharacterized protein n=1 Tax=Pyrrhoderma noxium TaxID=2282107 RepID=A0A286UMJ2_9AGAM|nr:hypothetical protein PNOK_0345400 [Pyrrhoderma noxium]
MNSPSRNAFTSAFDPSRSEANLRQSTGSPLSPASTISSSTPTRLPLRTIPSSYTPNKRLVIRADPTLVTCFDPSDKELYDLWAPKH